MLVIPVYIYRNMHLHDVVIFGELLAVAVIIMCLLFVMADLGRPDRALHLLQRFNFPISMLTWDVIALNGYLLLNLHICGYLVYMAYCKRKPSPVFYVPFVFIAIVWAVSIHTVTAFLYVGLGGRPFWNSAIIAPRFLASAFAAGPAFIILTLQIVRHFTKYRVGKPSPVFYVPFVFIAIVWAVSIHTVTAFLYVGLGGRPFWNSAIIAPRFLASAFAAGPAFIILTLQIVRHFTKYRVGNDALLTLRRIVQVSMIINVFLLGCELFTEFYTDSAHVASAQYLYFGLHGRHALVPWIWTAIAFNLIAVVLLVLPASRGLNVLNVACVLCIVGIWIEKGMGLIVPAFVPTPLGEIVEYAPTWHETLVCLGIWAFGLLLYTIFVRISVPVLSGELTYQGNTGEDQPDSPAVRPQPE
jgi:Ni/Fe-hydrogenase subunit HybB-like protein